MMTKNETTTRCPECDTAVTGNRKFCPACGAPMPRRDRDSDEPKLGRGMTIFITAGMVILFALGTMYYITYSENPQHLRTVIEPDTSMAETNGPTFDRLAEDMVKIDSMRKAERREAEKMLNSIRHRNQDEDGTEEETDGTVENGTTMEKEEDGDNRPEPTVTTREPAPQTGTDPAGTGQIHQ